MLRSFNCGLGMLLVTSPEDAAAVRAEAGRACEAWEVGAVVRGACGVVVERAQLARPLAGGEGAVRVAVFISGEDGRPP